MVFHCLCISVHKYLFTLDHQK